MMRIPNDALEQHQVNLANLRREEASRRLVRGRPTLARLATVLVLCASLTVLLAAGGATESSAQEAVAEEETPRPNSWHATTFVRGRHGLRVITYWSKNAWMRAETLIVGHPVVTIVRGSDYIAFDRLTGKGVRIRRPENAVAQDGRLARPFGNDLDELKAQGAERVATENVGEQPTEVWRVTDRSGRRKLRVSASEPPLPMRLETFVRGGAETITTDYSGWSRGMHLPDAFFTPSSDLAIETLDYATFLTNPPVSARGMILYPELLHGPTPR